MRLIAARSCLLGYPQRVTAPSFSSRSPRSIIWACAYLSSAALLATGACSPEDSSSFGQAGTSSSGVPTAGSGSGNMAGTATGSGGSNPGAAGASPSGGVTSSGGTASSGGVLSSAGTGTPGGGSGGGAQKPCVDVQPPPTAEWPDATCENWATETTECTATWFANYCDVSCGRCVPEGGGGAGGGPAAVDCSTKGLPNVTSGNGYATRYWDCCQPHCAQFDGHRCGQDGVSSTGTGLPTVICWVCPIQRPSLQPERDLDDRQHAERLLRR